MNTDHMCLGPWHFAVGRQTLNPLIYVLLFQKAHRSGRFHNILMAGLLLCNRITWIKCLALKFRVKMIGVIVVCRFNSYPMSSGWKPHRFEFIATPPMCHCMQIIVTSTVWGVAYTNLLNPLHGEYIWRSIKRISMLKLISPWCHLYASVNWVSIESGNGWAQMRREAITWTNANYLSIGPLGTNFSENWMKIQNFSFM